MKKEILSSDLKEILSSDLILNSTFIKSVIWLKMIYILCVCVCLIRSDASAASFNSTPPVTLITAILSNS